MPEAKDKPPIDPNSKLGRALTVINESFKAAQRAAVKQPVDAIRLAYTATGTGPRVGAAIEGAKSAGESLQGAVHRAAVNQLMANSRNVPGYGKVAGWAADRMNEASGEPQAQPVVDAGEVDQPDVVDMGEIDDPLPPTRPEVSNRISARMNELMVKR